MKDARRYEELAEYARGRGYPDITGPAVQQWVKRGLLPHAHPIHAGFSRRTFAYPVACGRQLLDLCGIRYREKVRDLDAVAARLWFAGYELPGPAVRRALFRAGDLSRAEQLGGTLAAQRGEPAQSTEDAVGTFADAAAAQGVDAFGLRTPLAAADLAQGIADYAGHALASSDARPDSAGIEALGRVAGLTALEAHHLTSVADRWRPDAVRAAIDSASSEEIAAARAAARLGMAVVDDPSALLPAGRHLPLEWLGVLLAVSFLVLREAPTAREALLAGEAVLADGATGATVLRYSPS